MEFSKQQVTDSLRLFVTRRDALLHDDETTFEHHFQRFMEFCLSDPLVRSVIDLLDSIEVDPGQWWETISSEKMSDTSNLTFPSDIDTEFLLRFHILMSVKEKMDLVRQFGYVFGLYKHAEGKALFLTLIIRPFVDELSHRLGKITSYATPEARALQAVPLDRIPSENETRIFLSHKTVDKPIVFRYYQTLRELGYEPWLDEPEMPAGTNIEREIYRGFEESCAAVFFITENFKDEKYLAAEVDYAVMQKRKKGGKFSIITLRYPGASPVPDLLTPYVFKDVENDLDGFHQILRALPIELGPIRWKAEVVDG